MTPSAFLARRYLTSPQGRLFARFLTMIAIGSVALSVFALTMTVGVFHGFGHHLRDKLLGFSPHLTIHSDDDIGAALTTWAEEHGVRILPIVEGEVVAQIEGKEGYGDLGVRVRGIDAELLRELRSGHFYFASHLTPTGDESFAQLALQMDPESGRGGAILGSEVLFILGLHPETADQMQLTAPLGLVDPAGNLRPLTRTFDVRGFFRTGLYQHDSKLMLVDRREAEALLGAQANPRWFVYLDDPGQSGAVATLLQTRFGGVATVETWEDANQKLFGALRLERIVMTILLLLALGIASLSILGVVMMQIRTRERDLAIVTAMGAGRRLREATVLRLGASMGLLGTCVGLIVSGLVIWWVRGHPIQLPSSFYLDALPIEITVMSGLLIVCVGIGLPTLASWYPARVAGRFDPAVGLRSE